MIRIFFCGGIRDGFFIENMNCAVWSYHPRAQNGVFLVPRLPTGRDITPALGTLLREDLVKKIPRTDSPSLSIEYNRLFVIEKKDVGTRRRGHLRFALI
jgi:hypothetical protein